MNFLRECFNILPLIMIYGFLFLEKYNINKVRFQEEGWEKVWKILFFKLFLILISVIGLNYIKERFL